MLKEFHTNMYMQSVGGVSVKVTTTPVATGPTTTPASTQPPATRDPDSFSGKTLLFNSKSKVVSS